MDELARQIFDAACPPGTEVIYVDDDGRSTVTRIRSFRWQLGDGTDVVKIEGKSGGVLCDRIKILHAPESPALN